MKDAGNAGLSKFKLALTVKITKREKSHRKMGHSINH